MLLECVVLCVKVLDGVALPLKSVKLFAFFWLPTLRDGRRCYEAKLARRKKLPSCQRASNKGESKPDILENVSF